MLVQRDLRYRGRIKDAGFLKHGRQKEAERETERLL